MRQKLINYKGIDLDDYLNKILTNSFSFCFSGSFYTNINKWFVKNVKDIEDEQFGVRPYLTDTGDIDSIFNTYDRYPENELDNSNWVYYHSDGQNKFERLFSSKKVGHVYGLCGVYCKYKKLILLNINNSHNPIPMRIWINGHLVFYSTDMCLEKRLEIIFEFEEGLNYILVERKICPERRVRDRGLDTFVLIGIKPLEYIINEKQNNRFFDEDFTSNIKSGYSAVFEKVFYADSNNVNFIVIPKYFNGQTKVKLKGVFLTDKNNVLIENNINLGEVNSAIISCEYNTLIRFELRKNEERGSLFDSYLFSGDYDQYVIDINNELTEFTNENIQYSLSQLFYIFDFHKNKIRDSEYLICSNMLNQVFRKIFELQNYLIYIKAEGSLICNSIQPFKRYAFLFKEKKENFLAYCVYFPDNYSPKKKYPLIMHITLSEIYPLMGSTGNYMENWIKRNKNFQAIILLVPNKFYSSNLNEYLNNLVDVLHEVPNYFNIDFNRISINSICGYTKYATQLVASVPDVFSTIVNVSPVDFDLSNWNCYKNLNNNSVIQVQNVSDFAFLKVKNNSKYLANYLDWFDDGFEHEEFINLYSSKKLFLETIKNKRILYPKRIFYTMIDCSYVKSYWIIINQIEYIGTAFTIEASIEHNNIVVKTKNVNEFSILINKRKMGLNKTFYLKVNDQKMHLCLLNNYAIIHFKYFMNEWVSKITDMTRQDFDRQYNVLNCPNGT